MNNFGQYPVSSFLPPLAPLSIQTGVGWEYIRIVNNSSYLLNINLSGMGTMVMPEYFLEDIYLPSGYRGSLVITPQVNVSVVSHSTSNMLTINGYQHGEIAQPQAQPLSQPAVTTTASGKPIFSATYGLGATATNDQTVNIFNPLNSGAVYTFHSIRVFTSDSTKGNFSEIDLQPGADLNLATPVASACHTGVANPPISTAHVTALDSNAHPSTGTTIEVFDTTAGVTGDFLTFPDNMLLYPGNNLTLFFIQGGGGAAGFALRLTLKWTEDVVTLPIPVPGGVNVASSIKNDGNPAGTQIVESTVLGDGSSAVILTNTGVLTLGDAANPGDLNLLGAGNPAIDLSNASIIQCIKFLAGSLSRIKFGFTAVVTTGTAITHGLGATPQAVFVCPNSNFTCFVSAVGATTFTATPSVNGNIWWIALFA